MFLNRARNAVFDAANSYFRAHRGIGEEAVDIATFVKSKRADAAEFRSFVATSAEQKAAIDKNFDKAIALIDR